MVARRQRQEPAAPPPDLSLGANGANRALLSFVERIERLAEERGGIGEDIKEVFSEVKAAGFDTKILRQCIARRKVDTATRMECDDLLDVYETALRNAEKAEVAQSVAEGT